MAKRILGIILVLAVLAVAVMAVIESRSRTYPEVAPSDPSVVVQPDSTMQAPAADVPDSILRVR